MPEPQTGLDPNAGELRLMSVQDGDVKLTWNKANEDEVSVARSAFKKAQKKGMLFYETKFSGGRGKQVKEFDPNAERIVGVPALRGG